MSISTYQLLKAVGMSDACALRMLPAIKMQAFEADQVICSKGDKRQPFSYVLYGIVVCAGGPSGNGALNPVNLFGSGTWFGEASFLNQQSSSFNYLCLAPTRLVSIPYEHALAAFEQEAEFSRFIARLTNWRNQEHAEMLALMRSGSPAQCVVMGLAMLADAMLNNSSHLPKNLAGESLEIPLKQSLLASMCGVSRGIFSVCIQQLAAAGWLNINYATVELKPIKIWQQFAASQRQNQQCITKLAMPEILALMQMAADHASPAISHTAPKTQELNPHNNAHSQAPGVTQ
jgi:CRP-like cAMP-binding protein